ncbi:hypothetical protein MLD38_038143 [Melastoma candidum]|uniref:Uncharacterized protein n=1 Tax=Melastoma candidum TaxID=119954 RepID=A0ACB9KYP2_9MYRT|nr:hypothetical protein MLD38_038143 [Melastoma candidum]
MGGCCCCFSAKIAQSQELQEVGGDGPSNDSSWGVSLGDVRSVHRTEEQILQLCNLKQFSYNDLRLATRNFQPDSVLGEGGFGSVYKGWIDEQTLEPTKPGSGIVIAVKRLNPEGYQGHREWLAEINFLGQLSHPNLVRLIGCCLEGEHRLLIYEFMPRGSLEDHLFRRDSQFQPLAWKLRLEIALGAARGLAFLHSDEVRVIYRDLKASNILLASNFEAKLSDFGLAKDGPIGDKSHVSTRVMGTFGYAAPEYMSTGHLTKKSDVYSFGVVLLEMLCGRRAIDENKPAKEHNLVDWARPSLTNKHKIFDVLDPRLEGQYSVSGVLKVAKLAVCCIASEPRFRPRMDEVVKALERLLVAVEKKLPDDCPNETDHSSS